MAVEREGQIEMPSMDSKQQIIGAGSGSVELGLRKAGTPNGQLTFALFGVV